MKKRSDYIKNICDIYSACIRSDEYTADERNKNIGRVLDNYVASKKRSK